MAIKSTKGYKVTNANRTRIFGIACKSLAELKTKATLKFQLDSEENVNIYLQDGTLIDDEDYFQTIPQQTCFVLAAYHESFLTGADLIYNVLASVNADLLRTGALAKDFISENIKEKLKILTKITLRPTAKNSSSSREEDPEWFEGLDTRARSKEEFMKRRCGDRIRGYFYKAVSDVKKSSEYAGKGRKHLEDALQAMREKLASADYMGHYFVRGNKDAMCDKDGQFDCEGVWNLPQCGSELLSSLHWGADFDPWSTELILQDDMTNRASPPNSPHQRAPTKPGISSAPRSPQCTHQAKKPPSPDNTTPSSPDASPPPPSPQPDTHVSHKSSEGPIPPTPASMPALASPTQPAHNQHTTPPLSATPRPAEVYHQPSTSSASTDQLPVTQDSSSPAIPRLILKAVPSQNANNMEWKVVEKGKRQRSPDEAAATNAPKRLALPLVTSRELPLSGNPLPINVTDITSITTLKEVLKSKYKLKSSYSDVSIRLKSSSDNRKVVKTLEQNKFNFNFYQLPQEKPFQVAIYHLHPSTPPEYIASELNNLGYNILQVHNCISPRTRQPLSL